MTTTDTGQQTDDQMAQVLVDHQRRDAGSCLCGWSQWGASHAEHQWRMLKLAGAEARRLTVERLAAKWEAEIDAIRASPLAEPSSALARIAGIKTCIADVRAALAQEETRA